MTERRKVKVIVKSLSGELCKPCEEVKKEAEKLAKKLEDEVDIELVEVVVDPNKIEDSKEMIEYFGKDDFEKKSFPVVIVESECKSKKITGYSEGTLEEALKEVECERK